MHSKRAPLWLGLLLAALLAALGACEWHEADEETVYERQDTSEAGTGKVYMGREIGEVMGVITKFRKHG